MSNYKTMSKKMILALHKDCLWAAQQCPQYRKDPFEPDDILLGEVSKERVLEYWSSASVLWTAGYHIELSRNSLILIEEFRSEQSKKRLEDLMDYDDYA